MRCSSCNAEIPPNFVHSIRSNVCAGCGGPILKEDEKALLDELSSAIERMSSDIDGLAAGLAGWLMSNYRFEKIGDAIPVDKFHHKPSEKQRPEIDESELKIAESPVDSFLAKTDMYGKVKETQAKINQLKGGKLAKLAQAVQAVGDPDPYGFNEKDNSQEVDDASDEDIIAMKAMLKHGMDPFAGEKVGGIRAAENRVLGQEEIMAINSVVNESNDDFLPQERALLATKEGRDAVMINRLKRIKAQQAVTSGSGGAFRRS